MSRTRPSEEGRSATSSGRACSKYERGLSCGSAEIRQLARYACRVLPRFDRRQLVLIGVCGAVQLVVVVLVAAKQPTSGALAIVAALVLAPVAVAGVAVAAARLAGGWFGVAASVVLLLLPLVGHRFVIPVDRADYDRHALPALLGLHAPGMLALGVAAVWAIALLPERLAAGLGVVGLVVALVVWSPGALGDVKPMLHETAWSVAFAEWIVVASVAAAVLRRPYAGAAVACIALSAILRAAHQPYDDAGFWRALAPLAPAGGILLASLALLLPRRSPESRPAPVGS